MSQHDSQTTAELCKHDGKPCYASAGTNDAHWRCGTSQCSPEQPQTTARTRTVWTPDGYLKFEWRPDPDCLICAGAGSAWQHRTYGDQQYHGQYFEDCDRCSAPPKEIPHAN